VIRPYEARIYYEITNKSWLILHPYDGSEMFLRNVCWLSVDYTALYRVSQEEKSIFWEAKVSVILSKKVYTYMCPIPNGFRDGAISLYSTLYAVGTRHVLTQVAKCIDVDGGIFENVLTR
jgi:hypothetical protein